MRFEYILLICVFILPLIYKIGYWQSIFEAQEYSLKKFCKFMRTRQGSEKIFHFWIFLEAPILCLSIIPLFSPPFEIFLYSVMLYFGFLYNIFVIGKIFRRKKVFPKLNSIILGVIILVLGDGILSYFIDMKYLYIFLIASLLFMPVYFMFIIFLKRKIINNYPEDHFER